MTIIYILKLKYNKYYVGKTEDIETRLADHFFQDAIYKASAWTSKYKPFDIVEIIIDADDFDEDKYTKIYMAKYGIQNVRGGTYTKMVLSENEIDQLIKEIRGAKNACYYCGCDTHYINDCKQLYMTKDSIKPKRMNNKSNVCYRCGREGHWVSECYAKRDINGYYLH